MQVGLQRVVTVARELDTIEWYASLAQVCRAFARLSKLSGKRVGGPVGLRRRARAGQGAVPIRDAAARGVFEVRQEMSRWDVENPRAVPSPE